MEDQVKKATTPKKPRATTARAAASKSAAPMTATKTVAPKKKTTKANGPDRTASHDQIAALAHRFWAERGHQHGHDAEDWFRAEHELIGKAS
jgi:Protein of unknown function (DUF2934)